MTSLTPSPVWSSNKAGDENEEGDEDDAMVQI